MSISDREQFSTALRGAQAALPPACQEGFARLAKLIRSRPGKFQLLIVDCRDERLRDRLIRDLDDILAVSQWRASVLQVSADGFASFADVERTLAERAETADVIHVQGGASWFDRSRWDDFNVRREAVAHRLKVSLVLWLDPESIRLLARVAIDLWAWRSAVVAFSTAQRPIPVERSPPERAIDVPRLPGDEAERIGAIREELSEADLPEDIRLELLAELGDALASVGQLDEAEGIFRSLTRRVVNERVRAGVWGRIADVRETRGELDEALRIRREEQLPVYERLGDVRERAMTMGRIADVLQTRGELDEVLHIRRKEQLPIFERLGDLRERAVTMGKIADVLQARGELDEAMRVRREEELPVFERIGDVRSRAIAVGKVADVLQARGELDEALRIRRKDELPIFERLGDVRARAVALGKIADVLQSRGELDEALRIRREDQLPVFERLGDVHGRAVTMGKIADALQARGKLEEALRIRREDVLPVYERLGDLRGKSVALHSIAVALMRTDSITQGREQEIHDCLAEAFIIATRLDIPDGIGAVGFPLAGVLAMQGLHADALTILDQAEAAFGRLGKVGNVRSCQQLRKRIGSTEPTQEAP